MFFMKDDRHHLCGLYCLLWDHGKLVALIVIIHEVGVHISSSYLGHLNWLGNFFRYFLWQIALVLRLKKVLDHS
jgi:hypothetical protein